VRAIDPEGSSDVDTVGGDVSRRGAPDREIRWLFTVGGITTATILPFFSPLLQERGLTPDRIGIILSAQAIASVVAAPLWSHEADTRWGTTRTLVASTLATSLCAGLLTLTGANVWAIGAVAALMAAASAPGTALGDALALAVLGPDRTSDYGRIRRFASGGWAIAVILFGAVYQHVGLWPVLPFYVAALLAYAVFAARLHGAAPREPLSHRTPRLSSIGAAFRGSPSLLPFLIGLLVLSAATSSTDGFVPLRMLGIGGGPFLIGLAAGLAAIIEIPFFTAGASLGRRFGMRNLFLVGVAFSILTLLGYAVSTTPEGVAVFRALAGVAFGLKYGALVILTDRLVPRRLRNTGQALMQTATWGLGPVIGPAIGGFVYVHLGPPALFAGAAFVASCAALLSWWALRGVGGPEPVAAARA
jgi:PPP family 3-phenylpropionic acid transporter